MAKICIFKASPKRLSLSDGEVQRIDADCIHILQRTGEVELPKGENTIEKVDGNRTCWWAYGLNR